MEKLRENIMKLNLRCKNFYLIIFILWFSMEIVLSTTLKAFLGIPVSTLNSATNMLVLMMLMLQILLLLPFYNQRELLIIAGITIPIVIAALLSGNKSLLSAWMFVVAAKNENTDRVIHTAYKILVILLPVVFIFCFFGLIEDNTLFMRNVQRFSLGFLHPNTLGVRILQLIICHCYVHRERLGIVNFLFVISAIIFVYVIPNSQTVCVCLILFLVMLIFYKYVRDKKGKILTIYSRMLLVGAFLINVISLVLSFMDVNRNPILHKIDFWMSSRFACAHRVWMLHGISFLGQKVYVTEAERKLVGITEKLWLDNAYMSIILVHGVLVFLIFSISYLWLMKYVAAQKKYMLVSILFLFAVYGIMETGLYSLGQNIFLVLFADLLYKKGENTLYEKSNL